MGKRPIASSTARRPTLESATTEEAFRTIEQRIADLENVESTTEVFDEYEDTFIQNEIRRLKRDIRALQARRTTTEEEAGDTYASGFKVTHTEGNSYVNISGGRIVDRGTTSVGAFTLPIALSNGTHYIYVNVYQKSGTWYYQFYEGTSVPNNYVDTAYYLVAEVDVVDGAIDGTTIIQHSYGEIVHPPDFKELYPFAVTRTENNMQVWIFQGRVITGTTTTVVGFDTVNIAGGSGTHYVYYQISFSGALTINVTESGIYPTNTEEYERFVVAEVEVDGGVITSIRQRRNSDFHSTRIWD